ncbi:OmpP1/FadL family transporter [Rhizobium sp. PAMB 3182]
MTTNSMIKGVLAALLATSAFTAAHAGGLEEAGYNIDDLFDTSVVTFDSHVTYVHPDRKFKNVKDTDASNGTSTGTTTADGAEDYTNYYAGLKFGMGKNVDCLLDYSEPWGVNSAPGTDWAGANDITEIKIYSHNYAGTCSVKFDVGPGQLRLIGGGFYQEVGGFKEAMVYAADPTSIGRLDLKGDGWGWRAGVAYEIPEYAMRASLVYNSSVDLGTISGTLDMSSVNSAYTSLGGSVWDVHGTAKMPDTLELKVQSGIAPDWLAFGSVKWTDWSQLQSIPFYLNANGAEATSLDLLYRDGWTITGGIGHKFNDQWSGAVSLTWDRGTTTGLTSQTDSWYVSVGTAWTPTENVELRLGGAVGLLTSGSVGEVDGYGTDASYDFGNDLVLALSTSLKVKF